MSFFEFAAGLITKVAISLAARSLGETIKDVKTQRRMARLVEDAVDRIVEQTEEYLRAEKVSDARKKILFGAICAKLQPLADDPQRFFAGDLDGSLIFKQCHPKGEMPQEIREEELGQFYTVLFPQIAHFLAGARIALAQWQAEGFREGFNRLRQLADEISKMNAKVADLPEAVMGRLADKGQQEAETLLREFAQTLLNSLLLRLDLSPLRAERSLYGSLGDHFVVPAFLERREDAKEIGQESTILDALAAWGARSIVHGGAGVGKTTWSLWLQSHLLQSDPSRLAVVLRLREITDIEKYSLLDLLRERAGTHLRDALTDKVLRKWHAAGRLVVILDGFDEVSEERRDGVEAWIKSLAVVANKTALLVTSRPLQSGHLERLDKPWQQWDLLPFDKPRILEFIKRWHRYLPEGELSAAERKVDAAELANTFANDPSLKALADTPLMLGTLLFVHHRDKKLPSGRVDLYERYMAAMLGLRDSGSGIEARATKLTDKEKRRVLAHIALHFHLHNINEVNDETMRQLVTDALAEFKFTEEVERLLPALSERTGLLLGPGAWSFMHETIGEFLVAEVICDGTIRLPDGRRLDRKELWAHRHEDAWTGVLFFWAGKTTAHELEEFIRDLLEESSTRGALLALALLHDQGDRVVYETRRGMALRLIQREWPEGKEMMNRGIIIHLTPLIPKFAYSTIEARATELPGLSRITSVGALESLTELGLLTLADLKTCCQYVRASLTVSALYRMRGRMQNVRVHLSHLPATKLAVHCFFWNFDRRATVVELQDAVSEWLREFPEGRGWVPMLLMASSIAFDLLDRKGVVRSRSAYGNVLWEWREEPLAEDWLRESDDCRLVREGDTYDIFKITRASLLELGAGSWGVTPEEHSDLLAWCDRMMARRAELKMAEKR